MKENYCNPSSNVSDVVLQFEMASFYDLNSYPTVILRITV
jgi:hypothetical protein